MLAAVEGVTLRRSYRRTLEVLRWQLCGGTGKKRSNAPGVRGSAI